ncbi:class I SAM-dependent methyltransferase [Candidatus Pacearchaeota archaeon]|nr:class I SAM-dependent methyltransferase [Candidatus Pacearchaeota archaeon]
MEKHKASDYTGKGENYRKYRSGYSDTVLNLILAHTGLAYSEQSKTVADIGAGTGIFSRQLADKGLNVISVEPNDDMRANGEEYTKDYRNVSWRKGDGENTGLANKSVNLVTMASAFHWTDPNKSLPEFYRILKDKGYVTLLWNPLVKQGDPIQEQVEQIIQTNIPNLSRGFRSGENSKELLMSSGYFTDVLEMRHVHKSTQSKDHYISAWKAANHVRTSAEEIGPKVFDNIINSITDLLKDKETIDVPYLTKAWIAQKK